MPNPTPPAAPAAGPSSSAPESFRNFNIPPPPVAGSPITICTNGTAPIPSAELAKLRASLLLSRIVAAERVQVCESNQRILADRMTAGLPRESERKRRREEDERRERERSEKAERDRVEREKEERESLRRASVPSVKQEQEEERKPAKRPKDKPRASADVSQAVQSKDAERRQGGKTDAQGDVVMSDLSGSTSVAATPSSAAMPVSKIPAKGARPIALSPDAEDEPVQPRPPRPHDKKKRKRDHVFDSDASATEDDQPLLQRMRTIDSTAASSPAASSFAPTLTVTFANLNGGPDGVAAIQTKLKEERFTKHSIPIKPPPPGSATAFYVPAHALVPPRPPAIPPASTPKRQGDVTGDFSNAKPGQQIAHSTFQNWVDAYLRPFGEDDLAFLAPKPEDLTPYIIPPLGKHYLDRWEEEDSDVPLRRHDSSYTSPLEPPVLPRLRPDALTEDSLGTEHVFLGPLSERLMAALAVDEVPDVGGEDELDVPMEEGPVPPTLPMDAVDLEERVKRELRYIGVLPEEDPDWGSREDDEISSALRACQRLLHHQTSLNEARKSVLMSLVKDRMAYQDYENARDAQERVIEQGWQKRMRVDVKKKKGKDRDRRAGGGGASGAGGMATGGKGEDGSKQPVSLELLEAVERRDRLVSAFKPFFDEDEVGRYFGLPKRSVYEGLEAALAAEEDGFDTADEADGVGSAGPAGG
ncbi:transcriptional regulator Ngg1 [Rhodotorula toruloides]|uniref:Transcriptional regulator Ngg1 n=1 Tax=Rhodotorula toruloides TaxID=5286 RepID=A0A511KMI9_RHOTO|nr:transcriptional regulator Ngg1 [Rhodotorula toruloides]